MHYVYILKLHDGRHYTGHADDLRQRVEQHKHSSVFTTKNEKVDEIASYAAFKTKKKAIAFEKYLKSSSGFAFRNKRLV
ncbi:MAG: GIY-YIG nuclease family protein [bacterium]